MDESTYLGPTAAAELAKLAKETAVTVDDRLDAGSTHPVQNKVVTVALNAKAGKDVATSGADGLMSKTDKAKLDKMSTDALPAPVLNPTNVQALVVDKYTTAYKLTSFDQLELPGAAESTNAPQTRSVKYALDRKASKDAATVEADGLMSKTDKTKLDGIEAEANKTIVDATLDASSTNPVQNKAVKAALDSKASAAEATTGAAGLMSAADKAKLDGIDAGANKTTVDAALDAASENPVQNKAVKEALDGKLSTRGGEISASLRVGQTVSAEGSVSVGRTSTDTGIHFEKAASDAGRISHGSDPMTGVSPIARLKVASPTEDDDAATKAYVDGAAVRYDAAQTLDDAQKAQARDNIDAPSAFAPILTSPVMIRKFGETESAGVYLSTIDTGEKWAEIRLEDVNENAPVAIANLRTPTGAGKDDYAATKGYVDSKVASGSGVTVDTAMSGTSTNPVQNKVIKQYVDGKVAAAGSNITVDAALSSTSTNPVQNKAVKAAIDAKADKTALDAKADKTALDGKLDKAGGTLTGNLTGKYITGTWLQSTAAANLGKTPGKIAVLDDSGWVYYRTPAELLADIGAMSGGDYYTKAETDAAIAVRASTSVYGTTKLSNSTTSSSKTLAATPYAVKTALAQAKAYVDSAIAVAINSAY